MRTSSAKAKGRRLCQEVKALFEQYAETLNQDDIIIMPTSVPGSDLRLSLNAKKFFPFDVECKNQEKINIWDSIKQSEVRAKDDEIPLVVFSRNRSDTYVCINVIAFLDLLKHGSNGFKRAGF